MKTRILISITSYFAVVRRCFFTTAALFVLVTGASVIPVSATAQGVNDRYYRFEEGVAGNCATGDGSIVDSIWGSADGTPSGCPIYSSDVPVAVIPLTGEPNTLSLAFNGAQSVLFNSFFLFHRGFGDATLEYFIKVPDQLHHAIFWTRPTTNPDANRFNIAINNAGGCGFDYREPSGVLHLTPAHISVFQIPVDTWTHIAVVRDTQSSPPAHIYNFFVNGVETATAVDPNPNEPDPDLMWSITGRSGYQFTGLIDEIRLTQRALTPEEFLIASPSTPIVQSAVSRKIHGSAGNFDVDLPLSGTPGIECRNTGGTNDYTMVLTFAANVTVTGSPQAEITVGTGCVGTGGVCAGNVSVNGNTVTVPLTNIANAQTINVRINGVNSAADAPTTDFTIAMSILWGDTNANRAVNAADISQTKSRTGQATDATNFRSDVNANGSINAADIALCKQYTGTALPPP